MLYYTSTHKSGMVMAENNIKIKSIRNVIVALFDPQLDHIPENPTAKELAKWRPATALLSLQGMPIVSKYILVVPTEHLEAAHRLVAPLKAVIHNTIHAKVKDKTKADALISKIKEPVQIRDVKYNNIWDIKSCTSTLDPILRNVIPKIPNVVKTGNGQTPRMPTVIISLLGSTTAAKTALFLTAKRLERDRGFHLNLVQYDYDKPAKSIRLHADTDSSLASIGLLRQGVGTQHPAYATALDQLERVILMFRDAKILITGPTGAGKSELARLIIEYMQTLHNDITKENCIVQNVAAIAPDLIDSELLGHEIGAFSDAIKQHIGVFERANNGILFLDEIGELPLYLQAKLLTILDGTPFTRVGGEVNVSPRFLLLCGTNKDLRKLCAEGKFRKDLYERISTWHIDVPALKDRPDDIERALQRELGEWKTAHKNEVMFAHGARKDFLDKAKQCAWEGNFREFHATFLNLALFAGKGGITKQAIEEEFNRKASRNQSETPSSVQMTSNQSNSSESVYDLAEMARLACALDICRKCKTATEAGEILFAARAESARRKQTGFNGASSLQRIFAQFGLEAHFKNGTFSVSPVTP